MKVFIWILSILSICVGLFLSIVSYVSHGLGLDGTAFGEVVCFMGIFALVVCIVGAVLGIIKLRKGNVKKAFAFVLMGLGYCAALGACMWIDDAVHTMLLEKRVAELNEQQYGENWDSAPAVEGIPVLYQEVLNKFYAVVRDRWTADRLMDLGVVSMPDYYGDAPLDNIGFALMDFNGDGVDELVIGAVAHAEQQGNAIFCICSDSENPFYSINAVEGDVYYLHFNEADGTYEAEIAGRDMAWAIKPAEQENTFDIDLKEGAVDPNGRMTLALTPLSQYK